MVWAMRVVFVADVLRGGLQHNLAEQVLTGEVPVRLLAPFRAAGHCHGAALTSCAMSGRGAPPTWDPVGESVARSPAAA